MKQQRNNKAKPGTSLKQRSSGVHKRTLTPKAKGLRVLKGAWLFAVISLFVSTLVFSFLPKQTALSLTAKTALIYGDSLTMESRFMTAQHFTTKKGWTHTVRAFGGTAPCDWVSWLPADLATYQPSVVSIATAGNISVSGCSVDTNGNPLVMDTQAYYDKYRADLTQFFSLVTATGAKVVFHKAPPMQDAARNRSVDKIHQIALELAGQYHGVSITSTARNAVSNSGKYTQLKTCLATETAALGCNTATNKITVRSSDGLHFCPITLAAYSTCNVYSSGEYRWSKAVVNATVSPPAPVLP